MTMTAPATRPIATTACSPEQHGADGVSGPGGLRRLADQVDRHPEQELRRQEQELVPGLAAHVHPAG
jgi:hypothetical protein